ncbi:MAG TPA: SPOR domain-containing protein [Gammaproteobacteria bacterium]|nr:SPOR domain-containing protein [Gammaproteobacteria bacterium]
MASGKRRRKESAPGWAWMLFGLSIGLSVALVVYLRSGSPSVPDRTNQTVTQTATRAEANLAAETAGQPAARASETPAASGGESQQSDEPAYSFFNDLSKSEVIVDTGEFDFGAGNGPPRVVLIQAGAFRDIDDADARQASLALLGYESHIDTGIVAGDLWFRVLIGPLTERGDINETVRRLRAARIETVLRTVTN